MASRAVNWHEGMFLRPHHFQTHERHVAEMTQRGDKWDLHYNWGLRSIDLDLGALANYRLAIRSLEARLPDGSMLAIPQDGDLPVLDLKGAFAESGTVTVYLALPTLRLGRINVAERTSPHDGVRFVLESQKVEDENTGSNSQPVPVRLPNVKLLLSSGDQTGYEALPIARIERSAKAEATPQLDLSYIPALLACDAWKPFQSEILHAIFDRIGRKLELLATQVVTRGIGIESPASGDLLIIAQLRELNQAFCSVRAWAFVDGLHPLTAYMELCRLVGNLSIFGPERRPPELPRYDHDDLGGTFYGIKRHIDELLNAFVEPDYKDRPFVGAGLRMQVALEPAWLEAGWQMFIGVESPLDAEEVIRLLTQAGQLDTKIGSSERVDSIFRMGLAGLRFTPSARPPRALPNRPGLTYFQVSRDAQQDEWQQVQRSLTLAIRLNENLIAGNIQGQRVLTIKAGAATTTLQFTLYVVPQNAV